jgi:hypothetical protein
MPTELQMEAAESHRVESIPFRIAYRTEEGAEIFIFIPEFELGLGECDHHSVRSSCHCAFHT